MKYYILSEGAGDTSLDKGGAEFTFIKTLIHLYGESKDIDIIFANGNLNLEPEFIKLSNKFNSGDVFILFFDFVPLIGNTTSIKMLRYFSSVCRSKGVIFRHTTYYCFEELFLSYTGIFSILNLSEGDKFNLKRLQNCLNSGTSYYSDKNLVNYWGSVVNGRFTTRESLSSMICSYLYRKTKCKFSVSKNKLGECWIKDCREAFKNCPNFCDTYCFYVCKDNTVLSKLADLCKNSVSRFSKPFSTVFD